MKLAKKLTKKQPLFIVTGASCVGKSTLCGVEYLKAAGNYEPAIEALKHYKKNLFGVWRRK